MDGKDYQAGICITRTRIRVPFLVIALALLGQSNQAAASEPPKELYGKSVVVSWNEHRVQRRQDQPEFRNVTIRGQYFAYVSGQGRVFNRVRMENPRGESGQRDRIGDTDRRTTEFAGNRMVAVQKAPAGGARQIVISFAAGYTGCNAQVLRGIEEGHDRIVAESVIRPGMKVEIKSVKTSGVTCQVRDGNVFGNE